MRSSSDPDRDGRERLPPALADRLGYLLGQAHLAHRRVAEAELASLDLRPKEFGALSVLGTEGAMSQQRLGKTTGIDRTTMVAVADELERKGFVERRRDPEDRRAYALQTTVRGLRTLERATKAAKRAEARFLARMSPDEQRQLKRVLRELIAPEGSE